MSLSFKTLIAVLSASLTICLAPAFAQTQASTSDLTIKQMIESQIVSGQTKVQIAYIEVDPKKIEQFRQIVWRVGEISTQKEPGVLLLFAASEKERPEQFSVIEIYKDQAAYEHHIKTEHFLSYKKLRNPLLSPLSSFNTMLWSHKYRSKNVRFKIKENTLCLLLLLKPCR